MGDHIYINGRPYIYRTVEQEMRDHIYRKWETIYIYTYTELHHVAHGMRDMSQKIPKKMSILLDLEL